MTRRSAVAILSAAAAAAAPPESGAIRVQLVTGGHPHDFSFYSVFDGAKDLAITADAHPSAFRREMRKEVDVLVLYDMADVTEEPRQKRLRDFIEAGKGLVVLHHAIADNQNWPWWSEEVTGVRYVLKAEPDKPASTYKHDIDMDVQVAVRHPVTAGIDRFLIHDEGYKGMWISPKATPLLKTEHPSSDSTVAWIGPNQKSRVVVIQLGHGPEAHRSPEFRRLVRQAIHWAAGRTS